MCKSFLPSLALSLVCVASGFASDKQMTGDTQMPAMSPSVWPQMEKDLGLSFSADFLYWNANQGGMAYASIWNFVGISGQKDNENISFQSKPGVRASFGFKPGWDDWNIDFIWTHLNTKASGSVFLASPTYNYVVVGNFGVPATGINGNGASAHWSAWYNTADIDLTKSLTSSKSFGFKTHLGVRSLWLNEKYNISTFNNLNEDFTPNPYNTRGKFVQEIWGIGPMLGLDSQWNIGWGFSLFGKASASLIWSEVKSTSKGTYLITPPQTTLNQTAFFHTLLPEVDVLIGAAYNTGLAENRYNLNIHLGWELRTLFNVNYLGASYTSLGNFNLSGLTAGFEFDF